MDEVKSLGSDDTVYSNAIDCWAAMLNVAELRRTGGKMKRYCLNTGGSVRVLFFICFIFFCFSCLFYYMCRFIYVYIYV